MSSSTPVRAAFQTIPDAVQDVTTVFALVLATPATPTAAVATPRPFERQLAATRARFAAWVADVDAHSPSLDAALRRRHAAAALRDEVLLVLWGLAGQLYELMSVWQLGEDGSRLRRPRLIMACVVDAMDHLQELGGKIKGQRAEPGQHTGMKQLTESKD